MIKIKSMFAYWSFTIIILCFGINICFAEAAAQEGAAAPPVNQESGGHADEKRISLDLKGVDILELFRIISLKTGLTIVSSKSVSGRVNILLNNLTFQDALDVILASQDLASERKDDIINIMTASEYEKLYGKKFNEKRKFRSLKITYAKPSIIFNALGQLKSDIGKVIVDEASGTIFMIDIPEKLELMEKTAQDLDRVPDTDIMDLKYAKPADIKAQLSTAMTSGSGEVFVDERSSKVVVSDLPEKMKKLRRMIKAFDVEPQEVFIQAQIVEVTLNNQFQRGINWETLIQNGLHGMDLTGAFPLTMASNLKFNIGTFDTDKYNLVVQLLQTFGDTKILSKPSIAVINNQEAKVMVGTKEAYFTQTQSQAGTGTTVTSENVEYIDVGVKLNVTPTISRDGFVIMKIKPEVSTKSDTLTSSLGSKIPIVSTSEAETVVKVKDGTMIMIAGLMKDELRDTKLGVPLLSKIPFLGALFSSRDYQKKKTELVIFITPHIISGDANFPGAGSGKDNYESVLDREKAEEKSLSAEKDKTGSWENIKEKAKGIKEF